MKYLAISFLVFLFSCKPSEKTTKNNNQKETTIEFTVLKEGTNSGFKTAENKVINSTYELAKAWDILFANYMDKPPLPRVDFKLYHAILVTMGEKNSGGYSIKINSIKASKLKEEVLIHESSPGKSCMTTSVLTFPFQLIMLPKTKKEISFEKEEIIYECGKK